MPISPDMEQILHQARYAPERPRPTIPQDYLDKIPTLNSHDFPDNLRITDLARGPAEIQDGLRAILDQAGLTKGQRAGLSNILSDVERIGEYEITLGDIRSMTIKQLFSISKMFKWDRPSEESMKKLKKLCGSGIEQKIEPSGRRPQHIIF